MNAKVRTRDCLDPWTTVYVQATGDIAPCCWARPIGNLAQATIEEIVDGAAARELRRQLLSGQLGPDCRSCPARGYIAAPKLELKVHRLRRSTRRSRHFEELFGLRRDEERLSLLRREQGEARREFEELLAEGARPDAAAGAELAADRLSESQARSSRLALDIEEIERWLRLRSYRARKPVRWLARRTIAHALALFGPRWKNVGGGSLAS